MKLKMCIYYRNITKTDINLILQAIFPSWACFAYPLLQKINYLGEHVNILLSVNAVNHDYAAFLLQI